MLVCPGQAMPQRYAFPSLPSIQSVDGERSDAFRMRTSLCRRSAQNAFGQEQQVGPSMSRVRKHHRGETTKQRLRPFSSSANRDKSESVDALRGNLIQRGQAGVRQGAVSRGARLRFALSSMLLSGPVRLPAFARVGASRCSNAETTNPAARFAVLTKETIWHVTLIMTTQVSVQVRDETSKRGPASVIGRRRARTARDGTMPTRPTQRA